MSFYQLFGMSSAERLGEAELQNAKSVGDARYKETMKIYESDLAYVQDLQAQYDALVSQWKASGAPRNDQFWTILGMEQQLIDAYCKLERSEDDFFYCQERVCNINAMMC